MQRPTLFRNGAPSAILALVAAFVLALALTPAPLGAQSAISSRVAVDRCVDVPGGSRAQGTQLAIWSCHGGENQRFALQGNGEIRVYGSLCVDALGGGGRDGDAIGIWPCNGGANQRWQLTGSGELKGINGKCVDIAGGGSAPGTKLVLWSCHGGLNQRWSMGAASAGSSGGAPVRKLYVLDGTDSREVHHNSLYHLYERWNGPKYWQNGVNLMATNIDPAYDQVRNVLCQDVRPTSQGGGGVTEVFLAGYSRGAMMAVKLANEARRSCGANVRFLGLVDAVNTNIWNWPTQVDRGIPVAFHIRKRRWNEGVLTTRDIGGVLRLVHPQPVNHQQIVCNKEGNDSGWRWTLEQLVDRAQRAGGVFNPSTRSTTDC